MAHVLQGFPPLVQGETCTELADVNQTLVGLLQGPPFSSPLPLNSLWLQIFAEHSLSASHWLWFLKEIFNSQESTEHDLRQFIDSV